MIYLNLSDEGPLPQDPETDSRRQSPIQFLFQMWRLNNAPISCGRVKIALVEDVLANDMVPFPVVLLWDAREKRIKASVFIKRQVKTISQCLCGQNIS